MLLCSVCLDFLPEIQVNLSYFKAITLLVMYQCSSLHPDWMARSAAGAESKCSDLNGCRAVGFEQMEGNLNINIYMQGNGAYAQMVMENIISPIS